ncbi:hypothetical protein JCM11641_005101 [Rhodosporidiobolus odoratus]
MPDSLFGSDTDEERDGRSTAPAQPSPQGTVASCTPPPIPGLYLFRDALPLEMQHTLTEQLAEKVWVGHSDQVMLFDGPSGTSLPSYLDPLLQALPAILAPLPSSLRALVFHSTQPRQAILNLYFPGQGISPHVDLPRRYEDGIVGISLLSSTVMDFAPVSPRADEPVKTYSVRLRPGDVYVLSGEARWNWTHGIAYREEDLVEDDGHTGEMLRVRRGVRMSITLRRMKEGAELIGPADNAVDSGDND